MFHFKKLGIVLLLIGLFQVGCWDLKLGKKDAGTPDASDSADLDEQDEFERN